MFKRLFLPCNARASFPARLQLLERRAGTLALFVLLSILCGDKSTGEVLSWCTPSSPADSPQPGQLQPLQTSVLL